MSVVININSLLPSVWHFRNNTECMLYHVHFENNTQVSFIMKIFSCHLVGIWGITPKCMSWKSIFCFHLLSAHVIRNYSFLPSGGHFRDNTHVCHKKLFSAVIIVISWIAPECMLSWKVILFCHPLCILGIISACMSWEVTFCCNLVCFFGIIP